MIETQEKNIARFSSLISTLGPIYASQHKEADIDKMKMLIKKASIKDVSVLICGEFKRGKSSFINAFLGENICPADPGIATSVVSIIRYGATRKVTRLYGDVKNLQSEAISFEEIEKYAKGSSMEVDNTIMLIIEVPSEKLKNGLVLMDTPGVGGLDPRHLFLTLYVMPKADVTLFVVDAGEPLSSTELDFFKNKILQYSTSPKIILNKSDLKSKEELSQLITDTQRKISEYCQIEDAKIEILPVSAMHWAMYNKNQSPKMKTSSNCEAIDKTLSDIVPEYRRNILDNLKSMMLSSIDSLIEKFEFQISQIETPDPAAQNEYKRRLLELKTMKDDISNPTSSMRKRITKVIRTTQTNVINELTRQCILFSTDCLDQLLKRPEAQGDKGGEWVLKQLNIGLEAIAAEVDQRILLGFTEVNQILGENIEISELGFTERINADLTPTEKDFATKACSFARNAMPGMGIASLTGAALSLFCGPVVIGLGALGAAAAYVYKSVSDQNTQSRLYEIKSRLSPQITIVMNDLKAYVSQRYESFNDALVENIETMTSELVAEMQDVMAELKRVDNDVQEAEKLKDQAQKQLNFCVAHRKQVELLLTNPFEKQ